jgi:WD40 repeat protein
LDGRRLATGSQTVQVEPCLARVWDSETGQPITPPLFHRDGVADVAFSPDGRLLATAHEDDVARLWNAQTGEPMTAPLRHAERELFCAAFSPDGTRLATAGRDSVFLLWDSMTGEPLTAPLPLPDAVSADRACQTLQFVGDGSILMTSHRGRIELWRLPSDPRPVADIRLHAQLLCGQRLDATGALEPLPLLTLSNTWQTLRTKYPERFRPVHR